MLAKINRITTREFDEVFKKGRWFDAEFFSLRIVSLERVDQTLVKNTGPLFAFVVSAKVSKKAVVRNKIKRRARYIVRKIFSSIKKDQAVMIFFKKGVDKLSFKDLEEKMLDGFKKARVMA